MFNSVEAFQKVFGPHAKEIMGDIPNYTDLSPVMQSETLRLRQSPAGTGLNLEGWQPALRLAGDDRFTGASGPPP